MAYVKQHLLFAGKMERKHLGVIMTILVILIILDSQPVAIYWWTLSLTSATCFLPSLSYVDALLKCIIQYNYRAIIYIYTRALIATHTTLNFKALYFNLKVLQSCFQPTFLLWSWIVFKCFTTHTVHPLTVSLSCTTIVVHI